MSKNFLVLSTEWESHITDAVSRQKTINFQTVQARLGAAILDELALSLQKSIFSKAKLLPITPCFIFLDTYYALNSSHTMKLCT